MLGGVEMLRMCSRSNKGSMTVEAAVVIPVVILCITAVFFMIILMYQRACLQALTDIAAERGAACWNNDGRDIATGKTSLKDLREQGLYWRIYDAAKEDKERKIEEYIASETGKRDVLTAESRESSTGMRNFVIQKRIEAKVKWNYRIPALKYLSLFGIERYSSADAAAVSSVNDPAELIRNTDFVIDLERELEMKYPAIREIGDKARKVMSDIKERVKNLFDGEE